ncbi:MAG: SMC family ATPase [Lachnospiraceae bacterium]|nr:SMC family ATPase [Lachnospiraceae bacterium]
MRLISCRVVGFGKLKELNIDFGKGLNAVQKENGWGKTTFLVFLKAMFFGLRGGSRRRLSEREHYRPWDGDVYGGTLTFEVGNRRYRIERLFGRKESEDRFALYDERDELSNDYTSDIGRELFQVDRDSFEKSVYIPQNALQTSLTDSLNAKMGDTSSTQDDVDNFDAAIQRLEEAKRSYTRNTKSDPGKLVVVQQELRRGQEALEQRAVVADALEKQTGVLEEKKESRARLREEKERILADIAVWSEREQSLGVYREKIESLAKLNQEFNEIERYFSSAMPTANQLETMEEMERGLEVDRTHLATLVDRLPTEEEAARLDRLFGNAQIDEELLDEWEKKAREIVELRLKCEHASLSEEEKEQLSDLAVYFENRNPTAKELEDAMADADLLAQYEGQVEALDERCRDARARAMVFGGEAPSSEDEEPKGRMYATTAIVVLVIGAISFGQILGGAFGWTMASICTGLALAVLGFMLSGERKRQAQEAGRLQALAREIEEAEESLKKKRQERDIQREKCRSFLSGFLVSPADSYAQMIGEIQRKKEAFSRLSKREEQTMEDSSDTLETLSALQVELYVVLGPYAELYRMNLNERHEERELIEKIKEDLKKYRSLDEAINEMDRLRGSIREAEANLYDFVRYFPLPEEEAGSGAELTEAGESEEGSADLTETYPSGDGTEAQVEDEFGDQSIMALQEAAAKREDYAEQLSQIRQKFVKYEDCRSRLSTLRKEIEEFESNHQIDEQSRSVMALQEEQIGLDTQIAELTIQIQKAQETESELLDQLEVLDEQAESLEVLMREEREYSSKVENYEKTIQYLNRARERFLSRYLGTLRTTLSQYLEMMGLDMERSGEGLQISLDMNLDVKISQYGAMREAGYFSTGYQDLIAFCTRLALVDVLYQTEEPFMILDDPFTNLDERIMKRMLALIKSIGNRRQIIYFTCQRSRMP